MRKSLATRPRNSPQSFSFLRRVWLAGACLLATSAQALPDIPSLNRCPDIIFNSGYQQQSQPSNGSGGAFPGNFTAQVFVPEAGASFNYYLHIPLNYQPGQAVPLIILWHGTAGNPAAAQTYAQNMRDFWQSASDQFGFIVAAQVATGSGGSWIPGNAGLILRYLIPAIEQDYNIETTRIYGYGFSAGGHLMHALMLDHPALPAIGNNLPNSEFFAAYGVSAGVLGGFTCPHPPPGHPDCDAVPLAAARQMRLFQSHGSSDPVVPLTYAQSDRVDFLNAGWQEGTNYWLDLFSGGHTVLTTYPAAYWNALCTATTLE